AIWSGTMLLHKQYVTPFYPMNSLQKLLDSEGYDNYVTRDPILQTVVRPSDNIHDLGKGLSWLKLELCQMLGELKDRLTERPPQASPLFLYTQPQNVHRMVLTGGKTPAGPGDRFPGFYEHYASEVQHIDGCFGGFIQFLKGNGLYDNSIVILTADHGDCLGEGGRWGHSVWIFPEILKIPLIIHLPPKIQKRVYWDSDAVAFATDITPTLYYLLGYRPIKQNAMFGRSLFAERGDRLDTGRHTSYLLAASYSPTYGILDNNGKSLFIADATAGREYYFDLAVDPKGNRNLVSGLDAAELAEKERFIADGIQEINRFFKYKTDH
ncbi:MAG TPA: sulfatase-like hydrolase/transferase, partial [Blastocatellia bacterium]